jgi:molybdenum cofactor biosynthesis enzyme MoaA
MKVESSPPLVSLKHLDELWFQVGGTLCNLSCRHCFISCHPQNHDFGFLGLEDVKRFLDESLELGVKEYYFTGGEPFLNRDLLAILEETLRRGPATVLTNATVFTERTVSELWDIAAKSRYSLEIRVSIDGYEAAMNDPIRGEGTFEAALRGLEMLVQRGFLPIITIVQTWPDGETHLVLRRFAAVLKLRGCSRPRIKILPTLRLGMEESRTRGYLPEERVSAEMLAGYDQDLLLCSHSRMVTDRGVAVCPILIEAPPAHMGSSLKEALRPFAIQHAACYTCYLYGAICANASAGASGADR